MLAEQFACLSCFFIMPVKIRAAPQDLRKQGDRPVFMGGMHVGLVLFIHHVFRLI